VDEDGVAKMAAPNHISPFLLSSTEQSALGLLRKAKPLKISYGGTAVK